MKLLLLLSLLIFSSPQELIHFSATAEKNNIQLKWQIQNAKDYAYFKLESSKDNINFETVKRIAVVDDEEHYSLLLKEIADGEYYYRLKLYKKSTGFEYSDPIQIEIGNGQVVGIPTGAKWRSDGYQYEQ
jgi:hypothetical protein